MTVPSGATDLTFSARRSALEPCLSWRLTEDALLCERDPEPAATPVRSGISLTLRALLPRLHTPPADRWPERILFDEIAFIQTRFDPTRFDPNRYRCDLRAESGAHISIFSTHYVRFGVFENRGDQYGPFVSNLVLRVQRTRPSVTLTTGLSWPSYLLQHGFLLLSLFALITLLGAAGFPLLGQFWVKLAIIVTYVGVALRHAWINIPRTLTLPSQSERDSRGARHPPRLD